MKKLLWIACLLCLMPFVGYAQFHASLGPQDYEELFGQATVSTELPSHLTLRGIEPKRDGGSNVWAHAMYIPPRLYNFGRYYEVSTTGEVSQKRMYNDWYYSSAEYRVDAVLPEYPVWAYANDYTKGFMALDFESGDFVEGTPIVGGLNTMNDITFDYHTMRMLGVKYGRIYEVTIANGTVISGQTSMIYDYEDHNNLMPIAIAADLNGDIYFVSTSNDGNATSKLYKYEADDDMTEDEPTLVGDLEWPARKIQTMAFDHNEGKLYWWACLEVVENGVSTSRSQLFEINKEDASKTAITDTTTTEIGGLFFEFDYSLHNVNLIHGTGGTLAIANNSTEHPNQFFPGETVQITNTPSACMHLAAITVYKTEDTQHTTPLNTKLHVTLANGVYTFVMPAYDVDVVATWEGNAHTISYTSTPANHVTGPATGTCGSEITVTFHNVVNYVLTSLTASENRANLDVTVTQAAAIANTPAATTYGGYAKFTLTDFDATVNGVYKQITLGQIEDICQFQAPESAPAVSVASYAASNYTVTFKVRKPGEQNWTTFTPADMVNPEKFDKDGTWTYRVDINNMYGTFKSNDKNFTVYAAPQSIALEGLQYNCEGDSIIIDVIGTPSTVTLNGTFDWYRNNVKIATTNVPQYVKDSIVKANDAGIYTVVFKPASGNNPVCQFTPENPLAINISTLPNKPIIDLVGVENPVCYNTEVEIQWLNGVLDPDQYELRWYGVKPTADLDNLDYDNDLVLIEGATGRILTTPHLTSDTSFVLRINYAGVNYLCDRYGDPFTINVQEEGVIPEIAGSIETCAGYVPEENPSVPEEYYTNVVWVFGNETIGWDTLPEANGNELHFENTDLNGDLLDVPGQYYVRVKADSLKMDGSTGCAMFGEYGFLVKELPDVWMVNNITDDSVRYSDHMPEVIIPVCYGTLVTLVAGGADSYVWGWEGGNANGDTLEFMAQETMDYEVTGHSNNTDCEQSVKVRVQVNPRPVITWLQPSADTTFSMITEEFQLSALPVPANDNQRGIYTYIIPSDPLHQSHPIDNGLFKPAELGIGQYWLIYSFEDENGCLNEARLNIEVVKPYWTDKDIRDTTWFANCQAAGRFEITNPYQLGAFAAYIDYNILDDYDKEGIYFYDFADDTIYITNNIDLQEKPYFYRPINEFEGVLDATGKVVSNAVLMEEGLTVTFNGFIRNIGFKDPKLVNTGNEETRITCDPTGRFHNSYGTMPDLTNIKIRPTTRGDVRNVYYYGPDFRDGHEGEYLKVYIESTNNPQFYAVSGPDTLCHEKETKLDVEYEGILQDWVWLQNDFSYYDWMTDNGGANYGYPVFNTRFVHHHYVNVITDQYDGEVGYSDNIGSRTIDGVEYRYAKHDETIQVTLTVDRYTAIDTVEVDIHNYLTAGNDIPKPQAQPYASPMVISIEMPLDSLYMEPYDVCIRPITHRDYWTDYGNFNETWYQDCAATGRWEITSNEDLAALARVVNYGYEHTYNTQNGDSIVTIDQYNFEGDTIWIVGTETTGSVFLNMVHHLWDPMVGFAGVLNGTHFIVDSVFVREDLSAMFIDMTGDVINLGVQDIDLPQPETREGCSVFALTEEFRERMNDPQYQVVPGRVINSFFTTQPELRREYNIADEEIPVINSYILNSNNMQVDGNGEGIDLTDLHNWVVAQVLANDENRYFYWDWIEDENEINYGYCIHAANHYVPGHAITYIPSIGNPNNGYVTGPEDAQEGTQVCGIEVFPAKGFNCTQLIVYYNDEPYDTILTNGNIAECFRMPAGPVTVTGTMTPIDWNFTLYFMEEGSNEMVANTYHSVQHYQDALQVNAPAVPGMVPAATVYENVMPNNHFVDTLFYTGDTLNVFFCEDMLYDEHFDTCYTDHENNEVRYRDNVTVTVVPAAGLSIANVVISYVDENTIEHVIYEGRDNEITFQMPRYDVTVCAEWDEEYWDDYGIADISWFFDNEDKTEYTLTTDSMLGGLAALVSSRQWLIDEGYYDADQLAQFDFSGVTIIVNSEQEENLIDLIEHKWRPIGAQVSFGKMFQGTFEGNGQKIVNMRTADIALIDEPGNGSCQAFFGNIGEHGIVNDLDIDGLAEGRYFTAGIAGVNWGMIMNCHSSVTVRSEFEAGGLVGNNYGTVVNSYCNSRWVECWSAAPEVTKDGPSGTNDYYVGGVAAFNENDALIINCHSMATLVKGAGTNPINYYGDLVGYNLGNVEYSYYRILAEPIGGGNTTISNCSTFSPSTAEALTAKAIEMSNDEYTFFSWKDEDNCPVFDRDRDFMSINSEEIHVNLYPNPTRGEVKIACNNTQIQKVTVFNMFGQMILDKEMNTFETSINLSNYTTGVYMVRITTANGIVTKNVVVE